MNIIIVNDYAYINGGAGHVAINTAKSLAQKGLQVTFFSCVGPIDESMSNMNNLDVVCVGQKDILSDDNRLRAAINGIWNRKASRVFQRVLERFSPNDTIIHIHALAKCISTSIIRVAKKNNFKLIFHMHDYGIACPNMGFYDYQKNEICKEKALGIKCLMRNCDSRSIMHKAWRVVRQWVQQKVGGLPNDIDCIIYISMFSIDKLNMYLSDKQRVVFLPNYITVEKKRRARAENNHYYVFVGRLVPEKNPELAAQATFNKNVPVIFVGDGRCSDKIYKINPQAEITGWKNSEEVREYIRNARALIFPSKWYEGQPLTVMEAMADGIPVIASDASAAIEQIHDGENGIIFKSNDLKSLEVILEKLSCNDIVEKYSKNAYNDYWKKNYNEDVYIDKLINIYDEVLEGEKKN